MIKIIGIFGYLGSGKSSTAAYLQGKEPYKYTVIHLADKLKQEAAVFYGLPIDVFYSVTKKDKKLSWSVCPSDNISSAIVHSIGASEYFTPRDLLIAYGAFRRFYNENYWLEAVLKEYKDEDKVLLIPDIRFKNEVLEIKSRNGKLIQVVKDGTGCARADDSEAQQKEFIPDLIIKAKPGIENLEKSIEKNLKKINRMFK